MYEFYYFEKKADNSGNHLIHRASCEHLPPIDNRTVLSYDNSSLAALNNAETEYLGKSFRLCTSCYKSLEIK